MSNGEVIAFTDGVIEQGGSSAGFRTEDLKQLIAETVEQAFAGPPTDDIAVLVLRRPPPS